MILKNRSLFGNFSSLNLDFHNSVKCPLLFISTALLNTLIDACPNVVEFHIGCVRESDHSETWINPDGFENISKLKQLKKLSFRCLLLTNGSFLKEVFITLQSVNHFSLNLGFEIINFCRFFIIACSWTLYTS